MADIRELLSKNIKNARENLGYSQFKLAELCDLSTSYIGDIEIMKKFPSDKSLQKIADALGYKPYQLFLDDESQEFTNKVDLLTKIMKKLKESVNTDIDEVIKSFINS